MKRNKGEIESLIEEIKYWLNKLDLINLNDAYSLLARSLKILEVIKSDENLRKKVELSLRKKEMIEKV